MYQDYYRTLEDAGGVMNPGQFLAYCTPIKMQYNQRTVTPAHITPDGARCRWVIRDKAQRLRMRDAIAKDIHVLERHVFPTGVEIIEVLDMVDGVMYSISVVDFMKHREVLTANAGDQYLVERKHWGKQRVGNPLPEQGELFSFA
jgi:hypothetical protein